MRILVNFMAMVFAMTFLACTDPVAEDGSAVDAGDTEENPGIQFGESEDEEDHLKAELPVPTNGANLWMNVTNAAADAVSGQLDGATSLQIKETSQDYPDLPYTHVIEGIPAGTYDLTLLALEKELGHRFPGLAFQDGDNLVLDDIKLKPFGYIEGTITKVALNGEPLGASEGILVEWIFNRSTIEGKQLEGWNLSVRTDASGEFRLPVFEGKHLLRLSHAGYKTKFLEDVVVTSKETTTLDSISMVPDTPVGAISLPESVVIDGVRYTDKRTFRVDLDFEDATVVSVSTAPEAIAQRESKCDHEPEASSFVPYASTFDVYIPDEVTPDGSMSFPPRRRQYVCVAVKNDNGEVAFYEERFHFVSGIDTYSSDHQLFHDSNGYVVQAKFGVFDSETWNLITSIGMASSFDALDANMAEPGENDSFYSFPVDLTYWWEKAPIKVRIENYFGQVTETELDFYARQMVRLVTENLFPTTSECELGAARYTAVNATGDGMYVNPDLDPNSGCWRPAGGEPTPIGGLAQHQIMGLAGDEKNSDFWLILAERSSGDYLKDLKLAKWDGSAWQVVEPDDPSLDRPIVRSDSQVFAHGGELFLWGGREYSEVEGNPALVEYSSGSPKQTDLWSFADGAWERLHAGTAIDYGIVCNPDAILVPCPVPRSSFVVDEAADELWIWNTEYTQDVRYWKFALGSQTWSSSEFPLGIEALAGSDPDRYVKDLIFTDHGIFALVHFGSGLIRRYHDGVAVDYENSSPASAVNSLSGTGPAQIWLRETTEIAVFEIDAEVHTTKELKFGYPAALD